MNPQQLHTTSATHTHDFSFYDHHRRGDDASREHVRESDLLNTIMSFPSTSTQPFMLPRNSLQERIPGSFFIQGSNPSTVSFDVAGASRDEREQLLSSRAVCESAIPSSMGSLGADHKLRDKQPLSSIDSRYGGDPNILARYAGDNPSISGDGGGRGGLWPFSDRNDCIRSSVSAASDSSLQLPISTMRLGENLHSLSGPGHNIISTMLQANSDPGGHARYASHAQCRDGMWADDHGTELLLLPGTSAVASASHHQNIPHAQPQAGRGASVFIENLKPLNEYLNMHSSDQVREQNPSFHNISAYGTTSGTSGSSLRDLSLSLSAQENSQHVLYRGSGSLRGAGSACSNLQNSEYVKAAQKMLAEICSKAITEGIAGSFPLYGNAGLVNALVSSDLSSARMEEAQAGAGPSDQSSSLLALQQLRGSFDQVQEVPAAMAHLQLQDHHALVSRLQNDHLQVAPFMDRSQVELKRRRLFIMLEELEKRFKRYEEQMQVLVIALETSGVGLMLEGAAPYKEVAGQAIQKRFTYLRDAILASEAFIMGGFSGDAIASSHPLPGAGECDQAGTNAATRFRLLDQQLRHQRALQQVGLFPQPPWRPQRGLPERSVSLLRAWLFDHFLHPYPKDTEKVLLARQTGLTRNQVSNWFINARVRLWKPMVEEMYQEEMKTAELRRATGQGNPKKFISASSHSSRNVAGTSEFQLDQSKKHVQPDFENQVMSMQDLGSMSAMQGIETSRFFYKHNEILSDSQPGPFHSHQDEQVNFTTSIEVPAGKAMSTMLDAAQQCGTHTWPFIQHQNVSFNAQEQQHYCNSDISAALMRFGSTGGVTLTLGLQQHSSGGGGSMNCAGPSPFERSSDDVNAAHRWCE